MARPRGKGDSETKVTFQDDLDGLFQLPLTEFTAARNALAERLKKAGRSDEADRVKALSKPTISAWVVNQLYWKYRDEFNRLTAAGESVRRAQALQLAGKAADMRGPLAARRESISQLSRLASELLVNASHNPTPDTMRRVATTLEALSSYSSLSGSPQLGRLTEDVDPPGFESLAALVSNDQMEPASQKTPVVTFPPSARSTASKPDGARQTSIAAAQAEVKTAERTLRQTQAMKHDADAALKKAAAHANQTAKERREAEERFEKARKADDEARQRLESLTMEVEKAAKALHDTECAVERARKQLKERVVS